MQRVVPESIHKAKVWDGQNNLTLEKSLRRVQQISHEVQHSQFYLQCWNQNSISSVGHWIKQYAVLREQNKTCFKCQNSTGHRDVITQRQEGTEIIWKKSMCIILLPPLPKAQSLECATLPTRCKVFQFPPPLSKFSSASPIICTCTKACTPLSKRNRQFKKHEVWLLISNRFLSLQNTFLCLKALQAYIKANNQWLYALSMLQHRVKLELSVLSQWWLKYPLLGQETQIFEITN